MLAQKYRLGKTNDVQKVFARGRAFFNSALTIKYLSRPEKSVPRFTVVVSTKVAKSAVKRNRLKRLVREFIRIRLGKFKPGDYVVVLKPAASRRDEKLLIMGLAELCQNSRLMSL